MAKKRRKGPGNVGCAVTTLLVIATVLVAGLWFGQREEEARTPCEDYARTVHTSLDNCHSGVNRDRVHHEEVCEQSLEVTEECLGEIERMSRRDCRDLERHVQTTSFCRP